MADSTGSAVECRLSNLRKICTKRTQSVRGARRYLYRRRGDQHRSLLCVEQKRQYFQGARQAQLGAVCSRIGDSRARGRVYLRV